MLIGGNHIRISVRTKTSRGLSTLPNLSAIHSTAADLAERWGIFKATAGRCLRKMQEIGYLSMVAFPGTHGTAIYLKKYLSTMFQISDVMIDKD